jgi:hypothetical protein
MKLGRISVASVAAAALFMGLAVSPANASPMDSSEKAQAVRQLSAEELHNLDALLAATNTDELEFSPTDASQLGASAEAIEEYGATFVAVGGVLDESSSGLADTIELAAPMALAAACQGRNGYTGAYWFGLQYAANSCNTGALINGISLAVAGGAAYSAAAALTAIGLPAGAITGAVTAIVGVGLAFLVICRDTSSIGALYLNTGGVTPPTCWAQ